MRGFIKKKDRPSEGATKIKETQNSTKKLHDSTNNPDENIEGYQPSEQDIEIELDAHNIKYMEDAGNRVKGFTEIGVGVNKFFLNKLFRNTNANRRIHLAQTSEFNEVPVNNNSPYTVEQRTKKYLNEVFSVLKEECKKESDSIMSFLKNNGIHFVEKCDILSFIIATDDKTLNLVEDQSIKKEIVKRAKKVKKLLENNFYYDAKFLDKISDLSQEEKDKIKSNIGVTIEKAGDMWDENSNIERLKENMEELVRDIQVDLSKFGDNNTGLDYLSFKINNQLENSSADNEKRYGMALLFACVLGKSIVIKDKNDLDEFIKAIKGDTNSKYYAIVKTHLDQREKRDYEREYNYVRNLLIARYKEAQEISKNRRFYESDPLNTLKKDDKENPSGISIISNISNISEKLDQLNGYSIKSDINEHEDASLKYTAFDIAFNCTFNLNNDIVGKLANSNINLRLELLNYGIYDQNNNRFDERSRDKFVSDKQLNNLLTPEEIQELGNFMENLPSEIDKVYETLRGNFYADKNSFEKISKIYALGEVIDKVKVSLKEDNNKLSSFGFKLNENEPADIIGDNLFIKGNIDGTPVNIRYDLNTGELFMNSYIEITDDNNKIIIGGSNPTKCIGNINSFDSVISSINSPFNIVSEGNEIEVTDNKENKKEQDDILITLDKEIDSKLGEIGTNVNESIKGQSLKNTVAAKFLKTFGFINTNSSNPNKSTEFVKDESNVFRVLAAINNKDSDLNAFSYLMESLFDFCQMKWGENNIIQNTSKNGSGSVSLYHKINELNNGKNTIDTEHSSTILDLFDYVNKYFSSEKDSIMSNNSKNLSFADFIVDNFCDDKDKNTLNLHFIPSKMSKFSEIIDNNQVALNYEAR